MGALNRVEVGEWESWCDWIAVEHEEQPNAGLDSHLDVLADLAPDPGAFDELQRALRENDELRPPAPILGRTAA